MGRRSTSTKRLNIALTLVQFFIHVGYIAKLIVIFPATAIGKNIAKLKQKSQAIKFTIPKPVFPKREKPKKSFKLKLPSIIFKKKFKPPKFKFPILPKISLPKLSRISIPKASIKLPKTKVRFPAFPSFSRYSPLFLKSKYFIFGIFSATLIVGVYQMYTIVNNLPSPKSIGKVNYPLTTHISDRNGKLLYEVYRDQNRTPVKLDEIPDYITKATIAFEDKEFYNHKGISFIGGVRAARETFFKNNLQGGSTITQQLVKSALLSPERTIQRKLKEMILALWTERLYTKQEILEMYLNQVPYGGSSYGIEEAAKTYFGKHAKELKLEEAALLAGLPQAPSVYSPHVDPERALRRRNEVLRKMREQGFITKKELDATLSKSVDVKAPHINIRSPHFVFYIKSVLENLYGIRKVEEGGLKVTTTIDLDIQEDVERILDDELQKVQNLNISNGAILVTRPPTGEILAMIGSRNYYATPSGAFNVTTALRQPGSSIKPLMYSLALEDSYTPATIIDDSPVVYSAPGATPYAPVNYDGRFHGRVPLRYALANSYNIPAVKVLNTIGVDNFVNHAKKLGITTWEDSSMFGLSLTLGGGEVRMTDMATAFGVFANQGHKTPVTGILKIEDERGRVLYESAPKTTKVLDPGVAYQISDILADSAARQQAFGTRSALEVPEHKVAVKTGTTDNKKDNWTIGYTPEVLVAVWVGNNDNTPMHPTLTSGITGAAPIWNKTITYLLEKYGNGKRWFEKPENIVEKNCYSGKPEYFIQGKEGGANCREQLFLITPTPVQRPVVN